MRKAAGTKPEKSSKPRPAASGTRQGARRAPAKSGHGHPGQQQPCVTAIITLPAECTLRDAATLQAMLVSTVSPTASVSVDGGAVKRIDTAALQLLAAFARREQVAGRSVEWHSVSAELHKASARLGLSAVLQLPASAGAGT